MTADELVGLLGLETADPRVVAALESLGWAGAMKEGVILVGFDAPGLEIDVREGRLDELNFFASYRQPLPFGLTRRMAHEDIPFVRRGCISNGWAEYDCGRGLTLAVHLGSGELEVGVYPAVESAPA